MVAERILLMEHPKPSWGRVCTGGAARVKARRTCLFFRNVASEQRRNSSLIRKSNGCGGSSWRSPLITSARPLRVRPSGTANADSGMSTGSGSRDTKRTETVLASASAAAAISKDGVADSRSQFRAGGRTGRCKLPVAGAVGCRAGARTATPKLAATRKPVACEKGPFEGRECRSNCPCCPKHEGADASDLHAS
jgi:hypothetical protein